MPTIHYTGINQKVECSESNCTILSASIDNRIPHMHECGGNGQCTTCRVRILDGIENVSPRLKNEKDIAFQRNWDPSVRLACQTKILGDVKVQRLIWSSADINKFQTEMLPLDTGEKRSIAILCCDLRNFTKITSDNLVYDMVHMLNRFYTALGDPILMNNGIIYQYVGDEIIGLFGTAGGTNESVCTDAIRAAMGMRYSLERLNKFELTDLETNFEIGIGLHFGESYMGHMGHPKHRQFTIIGDTINLTSRIQNFTKETNNNILISEEFKKHLPADLLTFGATVNAQLKGKKLEMTLYEIIKFQKADMSFEIQSSLDILLKNQDNFTQTFYARLFEADPEVRKLFKGNMDNQGRLLMHMLSGIVHSLSRPKYLKLGLRSLGKNHQQYGVKEEHYPLVKRILLQTIEDQLGARHTNSIAESWEKALDIVISLMKPTS